MGNGDPDQGGVQTIEYRVEDIKYATDQKKAYVIEFEDALFHHESAVMLPSYPKGPTSKEGDVKSQEHTEQKEVSGIAVIAMIYKFIDKNSDKRFLITGHTDTTGKAQYNAWLSCLRGASVGFLLSDKKEKWAYVCDLKHKVEDYQQILKHYATLWSWDCDPGEIDNIRGSKTEKATRQFQKKYNEVFKQNIAVDGIVGEETWGAFFECYIKELADMMGTTPEGLEEYRKKMNYIYPKNYTCPCGESIPIEEPEKDNYRSQTNRRVEVLFFDQDEEPGPCPNFPDRLTGSNVSKFKNQPCNVDEDCPIYKKGLYKPEYIKPKSTPPGHQEPVNYITGTVWDAEDNIVKDALVKITALDGSENVVKTNEEGVYRSEYLKPGRYIVAVDAKGYGGTEKEVIIKPDGTAEVKNAGS